MKTVQNVYLADCAIKQYKMYKEGYWFPEDMANTKNIVYSIYLRVMLNKIKCHPILSAFVAIFLISCTSSRNVTIAFTDVYTLEKGAKLFLDTLPIGYVKKFTPNKSVDTIF